MADLLFKSYGVSLFRDHNGYFGYYKNNLFEYKDDKNYNIEGDSNGFIPFMRRLFSILSEYKYSSDYYNWSSFILNCDKDLESIDNLNDISDLNVIRILDNYNLYIKSSHPGIFLHKNDKENIYEIVGPLTYKDIELLNTFRIVENEMFIYKDDDIMFAVKDIIESKYSIMDLVNGYIYDTNKYTVIKRDIYNNKIEQATEEEYRCLFYLINSFITVYTDYYIEINSPYDVYREATYHNKIDININKLDIGYYATSFMGIYMAKSLNVPNIHNLINHRFVFIDKDMNII